jgi:hypothetical protein
MKNPFSIYREYKAAKAERDFEIKKLKSIVDVLRAKFNGVIVEIEDEITLPADKKFELHYDLTDEGFKPVKLTAGGKEYKFKSLQIQVKK